MKQRFFGQAAVFLLCFSQAAWGSVEIGLQYAQSADVWKTVSDVKQAEGNLQAINQVLNQKYGLPEEAFAKIGVGVTHALGEEGGFERLYLRVASEALGFGLVQNPVVPELHADGIVVGTAAGGYQTRIEGPAVDVRIGAIGGMGREKRIDAISTDLIDKIPVRGGSVTLYGADLGLARAFPLDSIYRIDADASLKETIFQTTTPSSSLDDVNNDQTIVTSRWMAKAQLGREVEVGGLDESRLFLQGIAGPQPLPVDFLPRVWDYVHQLYAFPELGTMFGTGLRWSGKFSQHASFDAHAGFYGGYAGGDVALTWRSITLTAASWGIETSSAYHTLGERFWQLALGFVF